MHERKPQVKWTTVESVCMSVKDVNPSHFWTFDTFFKFHHDLDQMTKATKKISFFISFIKSDDILTFLTSMQGRVLVCLAEYFKAYETQFSCYHVHDPLSLESVKSTLRLFRTGRTDAKGLSLCVLCLILGWSLFLETMLGYFAVDRVKCSCHPTHSTLPTVRGPSFIAFL